MPDDEPDKETISVKDLLGEIREGQREANRQQQETNNQLALLNGTVAALQEQSILHAHKLEDQADVLTDHTTRLAVVERVTEIRDEHQAQGIRNASGDAWVAQQTASDAVGWFRQAAVTAVMVLLLLLLVGALALLVFR